MKHIHFTPKILLAALAMLLMSHPLASRAQVATVSQRAQASCLYRSDQVLVRDWNQYYVTCASNSAYGTEYPEIVLVPRSHIPGYTMGIRLPKTVTVNDMLVYDDTLYFIGEKNDTGYLAYVDLPSILNGTANIGGEIFYIERFDATNHVYRYAGLTQARKMTLFVDKSKHISIIGQVRDSISDEYNHTITTRYNDCLADYDFATGYLTCIRDTNIVENFDEVLHTDKYLVAISSNAQSSLWNVRMFPRFPLNLNSASKDYAAITDFGYKPHSGLWGEAMNVDDFAVAFQGVSTSGSMYYAIIPQMRISSDPASPTGHSMTQYEDLLYAGVPSTLKDFAFNKNSNTFALLMNVGNVDGMLEINNHIGLALLNLSVDMKCIHSNADMGRGAFVGAAVSGTTLDLMFEDSPMVSRCSHTTNIPITAYSNPWNHAMTSLPAQVSETPGHWLDMRCERISIPYAETCYQ